MNMVLWLLILCGALVFTACYINLTNAIKKDHAPWRGSDILGPASVVAVILPALILFGRLAA